MADTTPGSEAGRLSTASFWQRLPSSGRLFFKFWGGVSLVALLGAIALQELSALHRSGHVPAATLPKVAAGKEQAPVGTASPASAPVQTIVNNGDPDSMFPPPPSGVHAIPAPLPALLEPAPGEPDHSLPKIGADGTSPGKVYAAVVPSVPAGNARIAILLDGFGLAEDLSRTAVLNLPSVVSFAIPAYAPARQSLLNGAREYGHELFLSLPMQPSTAPLDDEGPRALGYDHTTTVDRGNLLWALSRFNGYAGVTNAFSGLDGDAYAQSPDFRMVSKELNSRGLNYLNATPETSWLGPVAGENASITLDTNADSTGVDGQLAHLVTMAKSSGQAIAVAGPMRPVLLDRLAAWSRTLASQGVTLVPVSSLATSAAPVTAPSGLAQAVQISGTAPLPPAPPSFKTPVSPASSAVTETPLEPPASAPSAAPVSASGPAQHNN